MAGTGGGIPVMKGRMFIPSAPIVRKNLNRRSYHLLSELSLPENSAADSFR